VTLSNISLEQYNGDTDLQESLRSDLAETALAGATEDDVTLLGARTQASGSRRLLQQLLVVDYKIDFANMADAEVAKQNLLAVSSLTNVETYAQANGYAGLEADVLDDIDVVEVDRTSSGDGSSQGTNLTPTALGVAAGGGILLAVIALAIQKMNKGKGTTATKTASEEFTSIPMNSLTRSGDDAIELTSTDTDIVGMQTESGQEVLPSATV